MESNLLEKNNTAEVDRSIPKISAIVALTIATAISFSYFINATLKTPTAGIFTMAVASALLFIVFFFLQTLFIKGKTLNIFIILGETIALSIFFLINNYSLIMLAAIALTYLALTLVLKRSRKELKNQIRLRVMKIAKISMPKIITAIAILISAAYCQPFYPNNIIISKNLINTVIRPSETLIKIANNYLPLGLSNFSIDMTLPDMAKQITSGGLAQIAKQNNTPVETLTSQIDKLSESTLTSLKQQAEKLGLQVKDNETILDIIYNFINEKTRSLSQPWKWAFFGIMFLLIYFSIKSIFWFFYWLIYLFIFLFYEISIALGFANISYEQVSKETIIL